MLGGPARREGRRERHPDRLLERQPDDREPDLERLRRQRLVVWPARAGADEDERANELGPPQREHERDEAAHGVSVDVRAVEPARIEHGRCVVGQLLDRVRPGRLRGQPVPRLSKASTRRRSAYAGHCPREPHFDQPRPWIRSEREAVAVLLDVQLDQSALHDHRHALTAADAHRLEADRAVDRVEVVEQRAHDPRTGHAVRDGRARSRRRAG